MFYVYRVLDHRGRLLSIVNQQSLSDTTSAHVHGPRSKRSPRSGRASRRPGRSCEAGRRAGRGSASQSSSVARTIRAKAPVLPATADPKTGVSVLGSDPHKIDVLGALMGLDMQGYSREEGSDA
ncbi:hypothetical protein K466DRAFT_75142 [Polyporus arcularius HHB13444]|uniref:Uncharacterized protein n=1 Tax=Polyporus arcularius HHB13444 TaxID=1314778 RepID=A0A5C3PQJ5_9APHY|nr:hypothetical protein K466DRAFT_75142 [Polyporus arcularius HHB13444]